MNVNRTMLAGWALLIFAGTIWLHWPSVHGGFLTNMDDDLILQEAAHWQGKNWPAVQWALTNTQPYYRPLTRLTQVVDYKVWGTNAAGHHATNVVLHALNAALVFGFVWTLLASLSINERDKCSSRRPGGFFDGQAIQKRAAGTAAATPDRLAAVTTLTTSERLVMALGVAVVFAIHPLQVESVAWISGRTQLLCTACGIGCLWAYVAGARRWLVGALFVAALLCKPMAISLPFVMLAIDSYPLRRDEQFGWGRLLREKAAWLALSVAMVVATMITESRTGGLIMGLEVVRPLQRIFLAVQSLTFYPWKLVWPAWLSPYYPLGLGFSLHRVPVLLSALGVGLVTFVSFWRRRQTPALLAGWGAYVVLLLPVSGLAQTGGQAVADRYAYMALLPLLLLAGGAAIWLWRRCGSVARLVFVCLLIGEFGFFGVRARAQTLVWRNDESLWRGALVKFPNLPLAHNNLGSALDKEGRFSEATAEFTAALRLKPNFAEAHYNLANSLVDQGKLAEASAEYAATVRLKPEYAEAHLNLGNTLLGLGKVAEASAEYAATVRLKPEYAEAHYDWGNALVELGKLSEATTEYAAALRIKPNFAEAHYNLGNALLGLGKVSEATAEFAEAVRIKPDFAQAQAKLARLRAVP